MPENIIEKIWDAHVVPESGHPAVFAIDLMLLHEVTSAQAFDDLENAGEIYQFNTIDCDIRS